MRKAKRTIRKIKNGILKGTAMLASVTFVVSACCLDSDSWMPMIVCAVCGLWLMLFAYANGLMESDGRWQFSQMTR